MLEPIRRSRRWVNAGLEGFAGLGTALSDHSLQLFRDCPVLGNDDRHAVTLQHGLTVRCPWIGRRSGAKTQFLKMSNCLRISHSLILPLSQHRVIGQQHPPFFPRCCPAIVLAETQGRALRNPGKPRSAGLYFSSAMRALNLRQTAIDRVRFSSRSPGTW